MGQYKGAVPYFYVHLFETKITDTYAFFIF